MRILINITYYDYSQVEVKMNTTFAHCQRLVEEMKPIKDIVELYSALAVINQALEYCIFFYPLKIH